MNILITGANGQLGTTLREMLAKMQCPLGEIPAAYQGAHLSCADVDTLDIADQDAVQTWVERERPDLILNCAAMTNVDGCETDRESAFAANCTGVANLAAAAQSVGAKLVHVSTDYVFAGDATTPYCEQDATAPKTVYGESKLAGEKEAIALCEKTFVVRTSWLYGLVGHNFVKTMRRLGRERDAITVVNDQRGNPTNAVDLAYHMLLLGVTEHYGVYHCTGEGECSWWEFACEIMRLSGLACTVKPCTSEEYPSKTPRPKYSSLRNLHLEQTVGNSMRPWQDALVEYIGQLDAQGL
jgi:dTDP-4-dehydrorhamnose reductase